MITKQMFETCKYEVCYGTCTKTRKEFLDLYRMGAFTCVVAPRTKWQKAGGFLLSIKKGLRFHWKSPWWYPRMGGIELCGDFCAAMGIRRWEVHMPGVKSKNRAFASKMRRNWKRDFINNKQHKKRWKTPRKTWSFERIFRSDNERWSGGADNVHYVKYPVFLEIITYGLYS